MSSPWHPRPGIVTTHWLPTLEAMRELPALRTLQYGAQKESFEPFFRAKQWPVLLTFCFGVIAHIFWAPRI